MFLIFLFKKYLGEELILINYKNMVIIKIPKVIFFIMSQFKEKLC
jgi:hypothetical protein